MLQGKLHRKEEERKYLMTIETESLTQCNHYNWSVSILGQNYSVRLTGTGSEIVPLNNSHDFGTVRSTNGQ